jgi:hypothetical protein
MTKTAGSASISQRLGSADPDSDPHQNVMDPQHCKNTQILKRMVEHRSPEEDNNTGTVPSNKYDRMMYPIQQANVKNT